MPPGQEPVSIRAREGSVKPGGGGEESVGYRGEGWAAGARCCGGELQDEEGRVAIGTEPGSSEVECF